MPHRTLCANADAPLAAQAPRQAPPEPPTSTGLPVARCTNAALPFAV